MTVQEPANIDLHARGSPEDASAAAAAARAMAQERGMRQLWEQYSKKALPLESSSFYEHFYQQPPMTYREFLAKPEVLLLGPYSTGKTSMVRWLTGVDSPHLKIAVQPSTDKFMAVVYGDNELIPGCQPKLPYQGLGRFGTRFLENFSVLALESDRLREISLVDTPGIQAGSNHREDRGYPFESVCAWMAERAHLVLVVFDVHKIDISDNLKGILKDLEKHFNKVRFLLNKADSVKAEHLSGVSDALSFNLGRIFSKPEVKTYKGSFWDEEYAHQERRLEFDDDKQKILQELRELPRRSLLDKTNILLARYRQLKALYCILTTIRGSMPWRLRTFGSEAAVREWIEANLLHLMAEAKRIRFLSDGDMPKPEAFLKQLWALHRDHLFSLPTWDHKVAETLDSLIDVEVPAVVDSADGTVPEAMPRKRGWCAQRARDADDEPARTRRRYGP